MYVPIFTGPVYNCLIVKLAYTRYTFPFEIDPYNIELNAHKYTNTNVPFTIPVM